MSSVVHFRMFHANQSEPINFDGHQIRLLDLKKAIVEKKYGNKPGIDFDLRVSDADNISKGT